MPTTTRPRRPGSRFEDPTYLRGLLVRLHEAGSWDVDPEASELVRFTIRRFSPLARKHHVEPDDAGSAAFEVMVSESARTAEDPWAVIVHAVTITLRATQFADEALCSVETARRGGLSGCRAERFSERDLSVWEHLSGFSVGFSSGLDLDGEPAGPISPSIRDQAARIARLFARCGWDFLTALDAVEVILLRVADSGSLPAAYESLRRDETLRLSVDLPKASWTGILRALLGVPGDDYAHTRHGQGLLVRLGLGDSDRDLDTDRDLASTIGALAPRAGRGRGDGRR
jgi:hypothetical protein